MAYNFTVPLSPSRRGNHDAPSSTSAIPALLDLGRSKEGGQDVTEVQRVCLEKRSREEEVHQQRGARDSYRRGAVQEGEDDEACEQQPGEEAVFEGQLGHYRIHDRDALLNEDLVCITLRKSRPAADDGMRHRLVQVVVYTLVGLDEPRVGARRLGAAL